MRGRNKETPLLGRQAGDIIASGVMQRRLRSALRIFNDTSITNSHCKCVEVAHPLDAMNKESVRKQSIRSWLDRLRASALYQHEVPHGCR